MRLFFSSACYPGDIFADPTLTVGMPGIEFSGGGRSLHLEGLAERIVTTFPNHADQLLIHNYFPVPKESFVFNLASIAPDTVSRSLDLARSAITLCQQLDIPYYSFHPGFMYEMRPGPPGAYMEYLPHTDQSYAKSLERLWYNVESLHTWAVACGTRLAIENLFPRRKGFRTALMITFEELEETLSGMPSDVGVLIDLGHLNVAATLFDIDKNRYIECVLEIFSDRIFEIHISGNDGTKDSHAPLPANDWQIKILKKFDACPGMHGEGINVTLEAHHLPKFQMVEQYHILKNEIGI